jgi:hypothetical protein
MNVPAAALDVGDDAFGMLIAPIPSTDFFDAYFERRILHVARADATYFRDVYDVGCVEEALVLGADRPDHFALVKHGAGKLAREELTTERRAVRNRSGRQPTRQMIDPRSILGAFAAGYTLNIMDASAFHPGLARRCNRIQAELGFYVHTNAYFTPPGAQGFGTHYDTHDTLIVQIDGTKEWQVFDPIVALPLESQPYSEAAHAGKLGPPRVVRLAPGDTLYIPHGFPHAAVTAEQRSLHLTFAIAPIRAVDLLESLVALAALQDVDLRRALWPGWHRDPTFAARFSAQLARIVPQAFAAERIAPAADLAFNDVFAVTRTSATGMFDTHAAFERLAPSSRVWLRDDTPFSLRERGDRVVIVLAGKLVSVAASARAGFVRLAQGPASFAEIEHILPGGEAAAFVGTLVREGLVHVESA